MFAAFVTLGLVIPSAVAEPDRATTVAEVEQAFNAAEAANEEVNALDVDIERTQAEIAALDEELVGIQSEYDEQRAVLGAAIVQQQIDTPLGPTASLLGSEDPSEFLEGLSAVQAFNATQAEALESFGTASAELSSRRAQLEQLNASLQANKDNAAAKRAEVQEAYDAAKAKLDRLDQAERQQFTSVKTDAVDIAIDVPASGRAAAAIQFAMAQLGKPYSYGGVGPGAYDCSGLTMASYAAAGISIPRVVGAQYNAGTPVSLDALQPGDLVMYGDMSHVGMYLGNGQVIHAANPSIPISITGMNRFSKAVRFG